MSFVAEPYAVFVDDLVGSLTGAVVRERFVLLPENEPYRLAHPDALPDTVRLRGIAGGEFRHFVGGIDFQLVDGVVVWSAADGEPAPGAVWPDRGTTFWVAYERPVDPQRPPRLTDRNPGSIVRTLAESFAREYAVLSTQLATVYEASFVDTASGTDLDQVAALVGVERRGKTFASGEVVFSRTSPAAADVFLPEGVLLSTADVPPVTVETTEARTLRAGTHSVTAPVQALEQGPSGVAGAETVTVLHRPILGVTAVSNPEPMAFADAETDEMLRRRIRRALSGGGRATGDAVIGALTAIEGVREQDVLLTEDHLGFPGLVKVTIAAELTAAQARLAAELIEQYRPAGVRFVHNLPLPAEPTVDPGLGSGGGGDGPAPDDVVTDVNENRYPLVAKATVTPTSADLTAAEKQALIATVDEALRAAVDEVGIEERVIYNRVVSAVMAIDGVYDAVVDLIPSGSGDTVGKVNVNPAPETRAHVAETDVTLQGALVALDVTANIELVGAGLLDPTGELARARDAIRAELVADLPGLAAGPAPHLRAGVLETVLDDTDTYVVDVVSYRAEFVDEGLRVQRNNAEITLQGDQQLWLRNLVVQQASQTEEES